MGEGELVASIADEPRGKAIGTKAQGLDAET